MKKLIGKSYLVVAVPLVLTACGGGSTGVGGTGGSGSAGGTPPPTNGCTAADCGYSAGSTTLAGVGVTEKRNLSLEVQNRSVDYGSAVVNIPGNSITYSDGDTSATFDVTVGDISDPDADLIAQNVPLGLVSLGPPLGGEYEFVKAVTGNYVLGLTPILYDGYVGLVTDVSAIPVGGIATYTGDASGGLDTGGLLPENLLGSVELTADFGGGTVDMTVDFNMATDGADWIEVTGMTIDGNAFSGGDLAIFEYDAIPAENNLTASNVLGDNASHQATGVFFGVDEALALAGVGTGTGPDEVAGAVVATGSDAELFFTYVAD